MSFYLVRVMREDGKKPQWFGIFPGPLSNLDYLVDEFVDPNFCQYKKTIGGIMWQLSEENDETECSEHIWHDMHSEIGWKWIYPR